MRVLKKLVLWLLVLIVLLIGVAFVLPNNAHVERTITIDRPPSEVFGVLNSMRRFNAWSPWFELDPNAKYTFSGPPNGKGAKSSWDGNDKVGKGSQVIVESVSNQRVKTVLDFGEMGQASANQELTPVGAATKVVWSFDKELPLNVDGKLPMNVIGRYMGLFMDKLIGADYERGQAKLKALVESFPSADITGVTGEVVDLAAQKILYVSGSSGVDAASAATALTAAYVAIGSYMEPNGIHLAGAPMTITTSYDATGWKFDAAMPVDNNEGPPGDQVKAGSTYAGKAVQFTHTGPYDKLGDTLAKAYAWLAVNGYKAKDRLIEEYVSDPGNTPPEQLQTRIKIPIE